MIAAMPITAVTLRGLLGRRRTLLMLLLVGLPVLVALLGRIAEGSLEVDRILDPLGIRTILPLVALVFGTAALGSELEDGTAVFLIIKPIPRWRILESSRGRPWRDVSCNATAPPTWPISRNSRLTPRSPSCSRTHVRETRPRLRTCSR